MAVATNPQFELGTGESLARARHLRGLTQREIAEAMGVSRSRYAQIELLAKISEGLRLRFTAAVREALVRRAAKALGDMRADVPS